MDVAAAKQSLYVSPDRYRHRYDGHATTLSLQNPPLNLVPSGIDGVRTIGIGASSSYDDADARVGSWSELAAAVEGLL